MGSPIAGCLTEPAVETGPVVDSVDAFGYVDTTLTFEQRRELLRMQQELKRLEMEEQELSLQAEGAARASNVTVGSGSSFDVAANLHLVPQFSERDPDTFFSLFEWVAEGRGWAD